MLSLAGIYLHSIWRLENKSHIQLILLVGAGRFERPTPCAQNRGASLIRQAMDS